MSKTNKETIFVTQPYLPPYEEIEPYLRDIWQSKWLTNNGKYHREFETILAEYLGVKYVSLISNGTLALVTALQELKITGEVITTPFSFVATSHALWWNNIKPVFADIEPDYFNLDPAKIEAAITPKTTAILPVHVYGNPCNVEAIENIAHTYGLKVIYDACHTFNTRINGESVLNFGDLSVMSFHATKVFTTFEGGAIISHDEETKKRIDNLKNFGFVDETNVVSPGINAKMNEFQAALGLVQLKHIEKVIEKRKTVAEYYRKNLRDIDGITFLNEISGVKNCYSYFPILIDTERFGKNRDDVYIGLKEMGIFTRRYFFPLISQFSVYKGLESAQPGNLPIAEEVAKKILCLPIYPDIGNDIIAKIIRFLKHS